MRIFIQGNQDVANWHLPVIKAKFSAFVQLCKNTGIKQDRFAHVFEDTGTYVFGQYFYGEECIQIYSPTRKTKVIKTSGYKEEFSTKPKTFYVSTVLGYFWIEVRYASGTPVVVLTKFIATQKAEDGITEEFIYPGFNLNAPGMLSGCVDASPAMRYVLSQNGGVMTGEGEEKGTIKLPEHINSSARITPLGGDSFALIYSDKGQEVSIRKINISGAGGEIVVELLYDEVISTLEAIDGNLSPANLCPNPTWIHRKCTGSYFSPNKTIGYHVDIGTDDSFVGNPLAIPGLYGNKLDNPEGEAYFNHANDLYRFANMIETPIGVVGSSITFCILAPTMYFQDVAPGLKRCWGGNGISQIEAGCLDYAGDSLIWMLSPRLIKATINLSTKERSFIDFSLDGNADEEIQIMSWNGSFSGKFFYSSRYDCTNVFFEEEGTKEVGSLCKWSETCVGNCGNYTDPVGYTGECPGKWQPLQQWAKYFREDLRHSKHLSLCFGNNVPRLDNPGDDGGFYFLFDGLWHLDGGVLWTNTLSAGNNCALCSVPVAGQNPGELVYFSLMGGDSIEWILAHGYEYVSNMEVVEPLGYHLMLDGAAAWHEMPGFIARVPEDINDEHVPIVMTGGVAYPASNIPGMTVKCERRFMNDPCLCDGGFAFVAEYSSISVGSVRLVKISGGCPPYNWQGNGVSFEDSLANVLPETVLELATEVYVRADACVAELVVLDACSSSVSVDDEYEVIGVVVGPTVLWQGTSSYYTHNLIVNPVYTGTLQVVSLGQDGAVLLLPENVEGGTASWVDACGNTASLTVTAIPVCDSNIPTTGYGNPIGLYVRHAYDGGVCGYVTSNVYYMYPWTFGQSCSDIGKPEDQWTTNKGLDNYVAVWFNSDPASCVEVHYIIDMV